MSNNEGSNSIGQGSSGVDQSQVMNNNMRTNTNATESTNFSTPNTRSRTRGRGGSELVANSARSATTGISQAQATGGDRNSIGSVLPSIEDSTLSNDAANTTEVSGEEPQDTDQVPISVSGTTLQPVRRPRFTPQTWNDIPPHDRYNHTPIAPHPGNAGTAYTANAQAFWTAWRTLINDGQTPDGFRSREAFMALQWYSTRGRVRSNMTAQQVREMSPAFEAFNEPNWPPAGRFVEDGGFHYNGFNTQGLVGGLNTYSSRPRHMGPPTSNRFRDTHNLNSQFPLGAGMLGSTHLAGSQVAQGLTQATPMRANNMSEIRSIRGQPQAATVLSRPSGGRERGPQDTFGLNGSQRRQQPMQPTQMNPSSQTQVQESVRARSIPRSIEASTETQNPSRNSINPSRQPATPQMVWTAENSMGQAPLHDDPFFIEHLYTHPDPYHTQHLPSQQTSSSHHLDEHAMMDLASSEPALKQHYNSGSYPFEQYAFQDQAAHPTIEQELPVHSEAQLASDPRYNLNCCSQKNSNARISHKNVDTEHRKHRDVAHAAQVDWFRPQEPQCPALNQYAVQYSNGLPPAAPDASAKVVSDLTEAEDEEVVFQRENKIDRPCATTSYYAAAEPVANADVGISQAKKNYSPAAQSPSGQSTRKRSATYIEAPGPEGPKQKKRRESNTTTTTSNHVPLPKEPRKRKGRPQRELDEIWEDKNQNKRIGPRSWFYPRNINQRPETDYELNKMKATLSKVINGRTGKFFAETRSLHQEWCLGKVDLATVEKAMKKGALNDNLISLWNARWGKKLNAAILTEAMTRLHEFEEELKGQQQQPAADSQRCPAEILFDIRRKLSRPELFFEFYQDSSDDIETVGMTRDMLRGLIDLDRKEYQLTVVFKALGRRNVLDDDMKKENQNSIDRILQRHAEGQWSGPPIVADSEEVVVEVNQVEANDKAQENNDNLEAEFEAAMQESDHDDVPDKEQGNEISLEAAFEAAMYEPDHDDVPDRAQGNQDSLEAPHEAQRHLSDKDAHETLIEEMFGDGEDSREFEGGLELEIIDDTAPKRKKIPKATNDEDLINVGKPMGLAALLMRASPDLEETREEPKAVEPKAVEPKAVERKAGKRKNPDTEDNNRAKRQRHGEEPGEGNSPVSPSASDAISRERPKVVQAQSSESLEPNHSASEAAHSPVSSVWDEATSGDTPGTSVSEPPDVAPSGDAGSSDNCHGSFPETPAFIPQPEVTSKTLKPPSARRKKGALPGAYGDIPGFSSETSTKSIQQPEVTSKTLKPPSARRKKGHLPGAYGPMPDFLFSGSKGRKR